MISISSPVLSLVDFEMALGFVSQEFKGWEIVGEGRHFLPQIERGFNDAVSSYDMSFSAHAPLSDINIGSLNPRIREVAVREITNAMHAARRMNIDTITVHPGFISPIGFLDRTAVYDRMRDSLSRIERASHDSGVRVAIENMPEMNISTGKTPQDLIKIVEGFDFGLCFDIGHAHTTGNIEAFLEHQDRFINIHIHDNHGGMDEHLPIGQGTIDFKKALGALRDYKGRYVIEARSLSDGVSAKAALQGLLGAL
jgi:sugar phosphate isomerase/epimerase